MDIPKNALNWFEIPVADFERARRFYSAIFNFEMPVFEMGESRLGILPYDQKGGGVGGAINQHERLKPSASGTLVYLNGGADLDVILGRVEKAGGRVLITKTVVTPEIGFIGLFQDTEGNTVGLHSDG